MMRLTVQLLLATLEEYVELEWPVVVLLDGEEVAIVVELVRELKHEGRVGVVSGSIRCVCADTVLCIFDERFLYEIWMRIQTGCRWYERNTRTFRLPDLPRRDAQTQ